MAHIISNVFLLGPTGVGKSVMINALQHTLATHLTDYFGEHELTIRLEVEPSDDYAIRPRPSGGQTAVKLEFERIWKKKTDSHYISSHSHESTINDDKGALVHAAGAQRIENIEQLKLIHRKIGALWQQMEEQGVANLILLDASRIKGNSIGNSSLEGSGFVDSPLEREVSQPLVGSLIYEGDDGHDPDVKEILREIEDMTFLSVFELQRMLRRLRELSEYIDLTFSINVDGIEQVETIKVRRKFAICVSKADLLGDKKQIELKSKDRIIYEQFDQGTLEELAKFRAKFGNENVKIFLTSSTGFTAFGKSAAEKDENSKNIVKDVRSWKPYNVFTPFFWIFQRLEEDVIEHLHPKAQGISKRIFGGASIKDYIEYPIE